MSIEIFDPEYYASIHAFLQTKDGVTYEIEDLTDDYEKFIFHIAHYNVNRSGDDVHVALNQITETERMYGVCKFTQLHVYEFFEGAVISKKTVASILAQGKAEVEARWKTIKHLPEREIMRLAGHLPEQLAPQKKYAEKKKKAARNPNLFYGD